MDKEKKRKKIVIVGSSNRSIVAFMFFVVACFTFACQNLDNKKADEKEVTGKNKEAILLAQKYCGACHQYVSPDKLPTDYWEVVLSKMSRYMGFDTERRFYGYTQVAVDRLDSAKIFPSEQIISREDWLKIVVFYLDESPDKLDLSNRPAIDFDLKQFEVKTVPWKTELKGPTFIEMLDSKNIAVGFSQVEDINEFYVIDVNGNVLQSKEIPSALASISQVGNEMYMAFMGAFVADDTPTGSIGKVNVDSDFDFSEPLVNVLDKRERPVALKALDVNGDNRVDIIASEFGKFLGGLNLYLQDESGGYDKTTLFSGPGANSIVIRDVNKDGLPDIYALISQGTEGVHLFVNKGGGNFESKKIINLPPYYGSVFIDLVDFDQDGLEDIILTNGDSGDFGNPEKSFHGIRLFKNKGKDVFEEDWFYPQQGAYKSIALDFDQDGDIDIASIGFFAHGTSLAKESFLYLENTGMKRKKVQFKTYSFSNAANSSFLVMDAGDVDGDGDQDLILGASTSLMSVQEMVGQLLEWQTNGGAVVILENTLK
jgi:hypothetical protein